MPQSAVKRADNGRTLPDNGLFDGLERQKHLLPCRAGKNRYAACTVKRNHGMRRRDRQNMVLPFRCLSAAYGCRISLLLRYFLLAAVISLLLRYSLPAAHAAVTTFLPTARLSHGNPLFWRVVARRYLDRFSLLGSEEGRMPGGFLGAVRRGRGGKGHLSERRRRRKNGQNGDSGVYKGDGKRSSLPDVPCSASCKSG